MIPALVSQANKIENIIKMAESEMKDDRLEMVSHLSKLICISTSGFLENGITMPLERYSIKNASPALSRYCNAHINKMINPTAERVSELLRAFHDEWANRYEAFIDEDGRREAINSVMARRNQIAHGVDAGIGLVTIKQYFLKCRLSVEHLNDDIIKP